MVIPSTVYQLFSILLLVVPGLVYAAVRRRLKGPVPEDRDFSVRLIRAIAVSAVLDLVYLWADGPRIVTLATAKAQSAGAPRGFAAHPREAGWLGLVLLVAVPGGLGLLAHVRLHKRPWPLGLAQVNHPTPSAWDRAAPRRGGCFVRVRATDGRWVGGWLDTDAFVSTYPEPRDIFIDTEWAMSADGEFLHRVVGSRGVYVPLATTERVAWVDWPGEEKPQPRAKPLLRRLTLAGTALWAVRWASRRWLRA